MKPSRMAVICLALCLDLLWGDPPNRYHPVAWMGATIGWAQRRSPAGGNLARFIYGLALTVGGMAAAAGLASPAQWLLSRQPRAIRWLACAVLLKMTFSLRGLMRAAAAVEGPLTAGNLDEARRQLAWHLVSRDTATLDPAQVAAATVESVAENASDGVVAPLLCYAVASLPGAMAYRFLNTCDAMLGYRDPAREWLGKAPARLDDVANLLPARVTALLIVLAAPLVHADAANALRIWRRDAGLTASPNAGHPMSAMAGALGVEMEKVSHYRLGAGQRRANAGDIRRSVRVVLVATGLGIATGLIIDSVIRLGPWRPRT